MSILPKYKGQSIRKYCEENKLPYQALLTRARKRSDDVAAVIVEVIAEYEALPMHANTKYVYGDESLESWSRKHTSRKKYYCNKLIRQRIRQGMTYDEAINK